MKRLLIIGAAGDVGQGIVAAAAARGWQCVASGRTLDRLEAVAARHETVSALAGDVDRPDAFKGPVVVIKSREEVGVGT